MGRDRVVTTGDDVRLPALGAWERWENVTSTASYHAGRVGHWINVLLKGGFFSLTVRKIVA